MPNSAVFRRPFRRRGQNWLPPTEPPVPPLGDVTGSGGLLVGGAATIEFVGFTGNVFGSGGALAGGAATVLRIGVIENVAAVGGVLAGGAAQIVHGDRIGAITGSGGALAGGSAEVRFMHAPPEPSNVVIEWDFDNDGDFSEDVEDITPYVISAETFTGRDWPSLLTGRAGPGKFRATMTNDDDRFSYFNGSSPLATAPYSLRTGRKLRVRTADATNPDPALLARDRFRRTAGALGSDETGNTYVEPLDDDFTISSNRAVAASEGDPHMALVDLDTADYYVQVKISVLGDATPANRVGVVYRYVDSNDYSLCVVDGAAESVRLIDVVSGSETVVASRSIEMYSGITLGVLVDGSTATAYVEGVAMASGTAPNTSADTAGFYAEWATGDTRPELDEFFAWAGLPAQVEGVLWTGDVSDLTSSVEVGPRKLADVSGEGWLTKLSGTDITPPNSPSGRKTGLLVGNALAKALLLHPPGRVDEGDVTTGTFAMQERSALEVARDVEETELGFLYETQEGHVSFRSRSHRDGSVSQVTFTDDPAGKYGYHRIEPYDSRREVFNRVSAGVSSWVEGEAAVLFTDPGPYVLAQGQIQTLQAAYDGIVARWTGHTRDIIAPGPPDGISASTTATSGATATFNVGLPSGIDAGDLLLVVFASRSANPWNRVVPAGWTGLNTSNLPYVIAKVAVGDEDSTSISLSSSGASPWVAHVYHVQDWHGSLTGVTVGARATSVSSTPNAPAVTVNWGIVPTLFISAYSVGGDVTQNSVPTGYTDAEFDEDSGIGMGSARKIATAASEDAGSFGISSSSIGWSAITIAVRGPESSTVQVSEALPSGSDPDFTIAYDADVAGQSTTISTEDFEDANLAVDVLSGTWFRTNATSHAGSWSYRSSVIGHNGSSEVVIQVPAATSTVRFWYRVSSESVDFFRFYVDGVLKFSASGLGSWTQSAAYDVSTASTITFRYTKDSSVSSGLDAAFIDDLAFTSVIQSHQNIQVSGVPLVQGDQTFAQADDYASQDEHNAIRTYQNSANLFANATDAQEYANRVLATYADDRPIVAMSFYASTSPAYRAQAVRRRVGDRITLVANNSTGFGISRDFYIESISHRWSHAGLLWETTWELSPA